MSDTSPHTPPTQSATPKELTSDERAEQQLEALKKWADDGEPMSAGARVIGVVLGLGLLFLAYYMYTHFTLFDSGAMDGGNPRGRGRFWLMVIGWLWSRPVAVIVGLIGLLATLGCALGGAGKKNPPT